MLKDGKKKIASCEKNFEQLFLQTDTKEKRNLKTNLEKTAYKTLSTPLLCCGLEHFKKLSDLEKISGLGEQADGT